MSARVALAAPHSENLIAGSPSESSSNLTIDGNGKARKARFNLPSCLLWNAKHSRLLIGELHSIRALYGKAVGGEVRSRVETFSGGWGNVPPLDLDAWIGGRLAVDPRARLTADYSFDAEIAPAQWNHVVQMWSIPQDPEGAIYVHDRHKNEARDTITRNVSRIGRDPDEDIMDAGKLFGQTSQSHEDVNLTPLNERLLLRQQGDIDGNNWNQQRLHRYRQTQRGTRLGPLTYSSRDGEDSSPTVLPDGSLILSELELFHQATFQFHQDCSSHIHVLGDSSVGVRNQRYIVDGNRMDARFRAVAGTVVFLEQGVLLVNDSGFLRLIYDSSYRHDEHFRKLALAPSADLAATMKKANGSEYGSGGADFRGRNVFTLSLKAAITPSAAAFSQAPAVDEQKEPAAAAAAAMPRPSSAWVSASAPPIAPSIRNVYSPLPAAAGPSIAAAPGVFSIPVAAAVGSQPRRSQDGYVFILMDTRHDFVRLNRHLDAVDQLQLPQLPSSYHRYLVEFTHDPETRLAQLRTVHRNVCFLRLERVTDCRSVDQSFRALLGVFGINCTVDGHRKWFNLPDDLTEERLLGMFESQTTTSLLRHPSDDAQATQEHYAEWA